MCDIAGEKNINEIEKGEIFEQIIKDYHLEKDKLLLYNFLNVREYKSTIGIPKILTLYCKILKG